MLAKLWKKVLLAVCIIACIFNIMSKLVNRHSLKENLESANDGVTVFDIFKKDDVKVTESEMIIDGVVNKDTTTNTVNEATTAEENIVTEENVVQEENTTEKTAEENATEKTAEETVVEDKTEEKDDKVFSFSDFTIIF